MQSDRGKGGVKRSLLTDGRGIPLGVVIDGANRNDCKLVERTLVGIPIRRPKPNRHQPQGIRMDKGYDYAFVRDIVAEYSLTAHIRSRGEEAKAKRRRGERARRWVVERTHSWLNRFRRILIRWEKRAASFLGMFASSLRDPVLAGC